jgi:hypothetical protein
MLEAALSNIHDFLWSDICISSTQLYWTSWRIRSLSSTFKLCIAGSIPFTN